MINLTLGKLVNPLFLCGVLALSACGNAGDLEQSKLIASELKGLKKSILAGKKGRAEGGAPANPLPVIERVLQNTPDVPFIFVVNEKTGSYAVAGPYGNNKTVSTWATENRQTYSFKRGHLVATRGLGNDLMSLEDRGAANLIAARRAGTVSKTYRFLNGEELTEKWQFTCAIQPGESQLVETGEISATTQIVNEACRAGEFTFTNTYWVDENSRVVQSLQWMGPVNGRRLFRQLRW